MHWRLFIAGLLVTALENGCSSDPDCTFEHVVEEGISGHDLRDCGYPSGSPFGQPADLAPWRDAHDCAVTSSSSQQPFVVRWLVPGVEGATKYAFVGRLSGDEWSLAQFTETFDADTTTRPTIEWMCTDLGDQGDCADLTRTLCLTCGQGALVRTCGE